MALAEYKRKRNFEKTPEPPPTLAASGRGQLSYLIQKHEATRLHYDFRLELDGVLLSWAVTKGPSLNPADKRLAVRVEDHPLAYGSFEGTIPKGQYGGGTVMLWDTGTWEPKGDPKAGLKKGHLSFQLHGKRLRGGWGLIRMRGGEKRENWLLVKERDEEAVPEGSNDDFLEKLALSVKTGRSMDQIASGASPGPNSPGPKRKSNKSGSKIESLMRHYPGVQLATLTDKPPSGPGWLHEIKFDGYRLLGFVSEHQVRLRTRNGHDWTRKFTRIADSLAKLKATDAVLDMESVVLDDHGKSSFQALQAALGTGEGSNGNIIAYVFDLLELDGKDLTKLPLSERKERLDALLSKSKLAPAIQYSEHISGEGNEVFDKSCALGLEGVVSKLAAAPYVAGRQRNWLKSKCGQRQEFIILGYSLARKGDRAMGALYLGYRKDDSFRYAGKVGTGFSMKGARDLVKRLDSIAVRKPVLVAAEMPGLPARERSSIRWVRPVLLCEVAFTEWTHDGRIRHPSFQGLREDKDADEVKQEKPVQAIPNTSKTLVLEGISVTHPDRVISKIGNVTKGELAEYYAAVAPFMLPAIVHRPISLLRCPSGIDSQCFFQRNPGKGLGPDVRPFKFNHKGKDFEYLYIEDIKGLIEITQMGAIEIHPWGARIDAIDYPDQMIFDLDPAPDVPFDALKLAAQHLRKLLKSKGLTSLLKCTGGKGLHLTVPLNGKEKWPDVKSFAASVANEMVKSAPDSYIATMSKAKRQGKIFIDYFRNDYTATAIADYSVRARPGAPVAVPLAWRELAALTSASQFTTKSVLTRMKGKKPGTFLRADPQAIS